MGHARKAATTGNRCRPPPSTSAWIWTSRSRASPADQLDIVLHGTRGKEIPIKYKSARGHEFTFAREFEGVIGNLERRYRETNSEYIRERITEYMSDKPCPTCKGKRLRPEAIAVTVAGANIIEVTSWPIQRTLEWINDLSGKKSALTRRQLAIAERVIKETRSRLGFPGRRGPGLPDAQPLCRLAFRRRSAAHPSGHAGGLSARWRSLRSR